LELGIASMHFQPDGTSDPRPPQPAIPARILGQILLVVVLGVVELAGRHDLGGDPLVAGVPELGLIRLARPFGGLALRVVVVVDA
jgi:hypothetical protein